MIRNKKKKAPTVAQEEKKQSKSAKKRESSALQKLGEELAALSPTARVELDLPDDLREALDMHDRIKDREGARRQRQFIGKLMRTIDVTPIARVLAVRKNLKNRQIVAFHNIEQTRNAILRASAEELDELLREVAADMEEGGLNADELPALAHAARDALSRSEAEGKKKSRELFRYLSRQGNA